MKAKCKPLVLILCCCLFALLCMPTAYANSAEPPRLVVIVSAPADDLQLSLRFGDDHVQEPVVLYKDSKAWEAQYSFAYNMVAHTDPSLENVTLLATSAGETFTYPLPPSLLDSYNNVITLDFANRTVTSGQTLARSALLVGMRLALTLLVEGLIFLAFGYRDKRSWLAFLIINLVTQGALNIALNQSFLGAYLILALVFYELLILITEMIAFACVIREHRKRRTILYVLVANLASLVLGGVLIFYLPV